MEKNFLDLPEKFSDFEKSKIVIISFGFEKLQVTSRAQNLDQKKLLKPQVKLNFWMRKNGLHLIKSVLPL